MALPPINANITTGSGSGDISADKTVNYTAPAVNYTNAIIAVAAVAALLVYFKYKG